MFRPGRMPSAAYWQDEDRWRPSGSGGQPGLRGNDHCLDAGLQGGVDDRRKTRVVISGDLANLASRLGFRVDHRIGAAHEPEYRRYMPSRSEASEVLARRRRLGHLDAVSREILSKGVGDTHRGLRIVRYKSVTVQDRDLRLSGRTRGLRLGIDNALDRGKHPRADRLVERANVQLDDGFVRYDVFLRAGLERTDGDDRRISRRNLARHN